MSASEEQPKKPRRPRRDFKAEFKEGAVKLVLDEGKTIPQVAKSLDLTESALRQWVQQAKVDRGQGKPSPGRHLMRSSSRATSIPSSSRMAS